MEATKDDTKVAYIDVDVITAEKRWCSACGRDYDLSGLRLVRRLPASPAEARRRPRLEINVRNSITTLCPDCARALIAQLKAALKAL